VSGAQIRLFVALELPGEVRAALGALSSRLRAKTGNSVRWVDPASLHLTLKFIGELDSGRLSAIQAALAAIRLPEPVLVVYGGAGTSRFPHPRVFAVGVQGSPPLRELAGAIDRALLPAGVPAEAREFFPHLTLARLKSGEESAFLRSEGQKLGVTEFGRASYAEFDLMQSTLRPQGAVYTRVERFAFAATARVEGD